VKIFLRNLLEAFLNNLIYKKNARDSNENSFLKESELGKEKRLEWIALKRPKEWLILSLQFFLKKVVIICKLTL
jgi:hypothetical protein